MSKILKATEVNIAKAATVIKKGGLVIFPTDTLYGLGCDAFNADAVSKIFVVKNRDANKSLPILIADLSQLDLLVKEISPLAKELIKKYWPGQLTIIFQTNRNTKVGIRMPKHRITCQLIHMSRTPLIGTSANLTGENNIRGVNDIPEKLLMGVDLVLDGGEIANPAPSTVIDITTKPPQILRRGILQLDL